MSNVNELSGQTMASVVVNGVHEIVFTTTEGQRYVMYHEQDCCESVTIDDICGDLHDLEGAPILMAEEASNSDIPSEEKWNDSCTWTFYKFATRKGYVTIRWYGESNGYYSESVDFRKE